MHLYQTLGITAHDAQGYHMYTDRYLTRIPLAEELLKMKSHLTGMTKVNQKGISMENRKPKFSEEKKLNHIEKNIRLLAWEDNKTP